jgi:diguanylate cyclase (GGDEF)-like protein
MMPLQIETISLITAIQAAFMAVMLWAGTYGDAGSVRQSLRIRSTALGVEALAWATLAAHAYLSPAMLLLFGNAFSLIAQGMSVFALRLLLGERPRGRVVFAVAVLGLLAVAWFGLIRPDYRWRVLCGSLAIAINILLSVEALLGVSVRRRSRARYVLLSIFAMAAIMLAWRNLELWLSLPPLDGITSPNNTNLFYVVFWSLQPLFAGIGFLLLYNEILRQELHMLARVDPLTGVSNRLAIYEATTMMLAQAARDRQPLAVLMLDADHFKDVNDRFGHNGGDKVLRELTASIRGTLRGSDMIGRVGGEEFVVLSPGANLAGARILAERIRSTVEATRLMIDGHVLNLTVSVGVAVAVTNDNDGIALLKRADAALYAAKRAGRNEVKAFTGNGDDLTG